MRTSLLLVFLAWATTAPGWGQTAHRAAAQVAEHFLSPEARIAVSEILGRETLARASTWPDFMRADASEFWQRTADPLHYVTVPDGEVYSASLNCPWNRGRTHSRKKSQKLCTGITRI